MMRTMLQAKLHRVTVTGARLDYDGSCGIDDTLLKAAGIATHQMIDVYNISNGERFTTYAIKAPAGSGEISLYGAAARKAVVGDLLIICAYANYDEADLRDYEPRVVHVNSDNSIQAPERVHASASSSR